MCAFPTSALRPSATRRKCAVGHVSAGGYSIECDACSESTPPLADNSACGCRAGYRVNSTEPLSCVQCESPLTYTAQVNRAFVCQQCTPYSYATEDFSSCVCGGGYYAAKVNADGGERFDWYLRQNLLLESQRHVPHSGSSGTPQRACPGP